MPTEGIRRAGRATQGVIVMRLREKGERVSSLAPVVEAENGTDVERMRKQSRRPSPSSPSAESPSRRSES